MRIALVHPKFDGSGGAERYASELAAGLAAAGHQVQVFARRAAGMPRGVTVHRLPAVTLGRALKTWSFCREAGRRVDPEAFEIVQGFGKTTCQTVHRTGGGVHRAFLERCGGTRRPSLYDRIVLKIEDALFASPRLTAVICPSHWVAGEVRRFYPGLAARLRVIANGVDTRRFAPEGRDAERVPRRRALGLPDAAPLLLFVATNFQLKGLDLAVEVLARIPEAHLAVAGRDEAGPFRAQAGRCGAASRMHFLGKVREIAPLYRAADLLLHPTRYDPFANVCLEAAACGTPVVTTDRNGFSDLGSGGAAARIVGIDAGAEAFGAAVRDLLERGEEARAAARDLALRNDQGRHLAQVLELYGEVVAARGLASAARGPA